LDNGKKYLVDCGLFQGSRQMEALNRREWGFNPAEISALFLTHAHIDHSGRIPKLVKDGFRGSIYTTLPTLELSKILLLDSAHIQEMEAEWQTRKNRRTGLSDVAPLYTVAQAEASLPLFREVPRNTLIDINPDLKIRFRNSGHILGSSILEVLSGPESNPHKVVFSGDLGHKDQLIVQDPDTITEADTLFIESTYGNRNHKSIEESERELLEAIRYSYKNKEKVIIPAFAVERTQEILYVLGQFFRKGLIPSMPVYLDSPLAIAATDIFRRMKSYYDEEALDILSNGHDPFAFPQLVNSRSSQDSMEINQTSGPAIVIAGNGMCTAGRIKHHLKHNLWRQGCSIVIVGFQANGTIGRKIVEGAQAVRIFGEKIAVRARVFTIGGFSAHSDQKGLLEWLGRFQNPLMQVYVIHGEQAVSEAFAALVSERFGLKTVVPGIGDIIPLRAPEPAAPVEKEEELPWRNYLMNVVHKAEQIRAVLEKSPQMLPDHLLRQLELELSNTQTRLDAILKEAENVKVETTSGKKG
jgi:metallo-beta-lactamase family protein